MLFCATRSPAAMRFALTRAHVFAMESAKRFGISIV
jgi:hypothetical protein